MTKQLNKEELETLQKLNAEFHELKGKIGEQMAPLLEEFYSKYDLADARFIGQPIDYIIFKNLST